MRLPDLKLHCDCAGLAIPSRQDGLGAKEPHDAIHTALASNVMRLLAAGVGGLGGAGGGDSMLLRLSGRVSGIMEELSETMAMLQDWSPAGGTSAVPAWRATCCVCAICCTRQHR